MQLKCRIVKEIRSICPVETDHIFLLSIRQDPLRRRARSPPTPGRFALISKQNDIDKNKSKEVLIYDREHSWGFSSRNIKH